MLHKTTHDGPVQRRFVIGDGMITHKADESLVARAIAVREKRLTVRFAMRAAGLEVVRNDG